MILRNFLLSFSIGWMLLRLDVFDEEQLWANGIYWFSFCSLEP